MRSPWQVMRLFLMWVTLAGLLVVLCAMYTPLNQWLAQPLVRDEVPRKSDVIIVLGGGVIVETESLPYGPQERVYRGMELWRERFGSVLILTGGLVDTTDLRESRIMRAFAEQHGQPHDTIVEEIDARDTHENAVNSKRIMEKRGWNTALVVTSYFHTRRACAVFEKEGVTITCIAAYPSADFQSNPYRNLIEFRSILRDYLATVYYALQDYI
ncbi:MAG: YdcF family protein [Candidatus Kerfeldbacteria bacterium]|nr:YdcF family protein [Candidatus Kerfeldbacteria bacterium]